MLRDYFRFIIDLSALQIYYYDIVLFRKSFVIKEENNNYIAYDELRKYHLLFSFC